MIDYFRIIHKYISPNSTTYRFFTHHSVLVTEKALRAGRRAGLNQTQLDFIEEAGMLHDIGIVRVRAEEIGCYGDKPYICHGVEGSMLLRDEGLEKHALVSESHVGVGITKEEVVAKQFPLPARDMVPLSIEEKILCWADLFFSKSFHKLWIEKTTDDVLERVRRYGARQARIFLAWQEEFGE